MTAEPPPEEPRPKALFTVKEAAEYLGFSQSKAYDLIHAGEFPVSVRRIGSQWMVSRLELDQWLSTPQSA